MITSNHNILITSTKKTINQNQKEDLKYNLGHYLGDNADELYVALTYKPIRSLTLKLHYVMANKYNEYNKLPNFKRQSIDTQNILMQLNIADDYFKAKKQISLIEEELQRKEKELYDWNTYKWSDGEGTSLIKYCSYSAYGMVDNKTTLEPEDDVAYVKLGDEWRMPTSSEVYELRYNCTWEWTEINGIKGELVTASNGNSIFLPAAGICYGKDLYDRRGSRVYYWSATTNGMNCAYYLHRGDKMMLSYEDYRYRGFPIRPVKQ